MTTRRQSPLEMTGIQYLIRHKIKIYTGFIPVFLFYGEFKTQTYFLFTPTSIKNNYIINKEKSIFYLIVGTESAK